jgi:hypothetical protein
MNTYHSDELGETITIIKRNANTVDIQIAMDDGSLPKIGKHFARYRRSNLATILSIGKFRKVSCKGV